MIVVQAIEPSEATIVELDGPQMAFFEIPLDYFCTPNGEIEPEGHPEATRLVQRVTYINFGVARNHDVEVVLSAVRVRLVELGGGYIWWRTRPHVMQDRSIRFRLGTTPELPAAWWDSLMRAIGSRGGESHG